MRDETSKPDAPDEIAVLSSDPDEKPPHIGPERTVLILRLKERNPNLTHQEIADVVRCDRSTVTRTLQLFENSTVKEARKYAQGKALQSTMVLGDQLHHKDARVQQGAAKAITALAGVQEGSAQVQVGVQVIVGSAQQPAGPDPFETITVNQQPQVIESKDS